MNVLTMENPYQSMISSMDALDVQIATALKQLAECPGAGCQVCETAFSTIQGIQESTRADRDMVTQRTLMDPESQNTLIMILVVGVSCQCAIQTVKILMSMVSAAHNVINDMATGKIEIVMERLFHQHSGDLRKAAEMIIAKCDEEMARTKNGAN
jgi:hypothetical protein